MTPDSLRAVTLKTVANGHQAAECAVAAYRLGGHRLIVAMRQGVDRAARRGAQRFAPRMVTVIQHVGKRVGRLAAKGLDAVSSRTTRVLEIGSDGVRSQVERVAELVGAVDCPVVSTRLRAAGRFSLPGAQVALTLSERLAAGASRLEIVAAGPRSSRVKAAQPQTARQPVATPSARPIKAVKVVKAVKAVKAVTTAKAAAADPTAATKPARRAAKTAAAPRVGAAKDVADTLAA